MQSRQKKKRGEAGDAEPEIKKPANEAGFLWPQIEICRFADETAAVTGRAISRLSWEESEGTIFIRKEDYGGDL